MNKRVFKLFLFIINILPLSIFAGAGSELLQNGDFENGKEKWTVSTKWSSIVSTNYGKTLKMIKPFNSIEWPCAYKVIELDPAKTYELSFNFQADNVRFGGELRIEFSQAKQKAIIRSFNACNTTWNQYRIKFRPAASKTQIMIRLWPGKKPGSTMLLDNVSLRESGNLLVPWSKRNINPKHQLHNGTYYYKILSGRAVINCDNSSFKQKTILNSKTEFIILSSAVKPLTEYKLSFDYELNADDRMTVLVKALDIDKKQIGETIKIQQNHNSSIAGEFETPAGAVWCKIIINLKNKKGNKFLLIAPILRQL